MMKVGRKSGTSSLLSYKAALCFLLHVFLTITATATSAIAMPLDQKADFSSSSSPSPTMDAANTTITSTTTATPNANDDATERRYGFFFVIAFLVAALVVLPLVLLFAISVHKCLERRRLHRAIDRNRAHRERQQQQDHQHQPQPHEWDGQHPIENSFASVQEEEDALQQHNQTAAALTTPRAQMAGEEPTEAETATISAASPPPTLEGYALENRVRPRQRPRHGTTRLEPTPHTVLTIHWDRLDPAQLPEAAPPPPSPREAARLAAAAARISSPDFYGRANYKDAQSSAPTSPVYINMNASLRGSPLLYHGGGGRATSSSIGHSTPEWSFAAPSGGGVIGGMMPPSPLMRTSGGGTTGSTASHYASSVEMNDYFDGHAQHHPHTQTADKSDGSRRLRPVLPLPPQLRTHSPLSLAQEQQYHLYNEEEDDNDHDNSAYNSGSYNNPSMEEEEPMYEVEDHDGDGYNNNGNQHHQHHDHHRRHTGKAQELNAGNAGGDVHLPHNNNNGHMYNFGPGNEEHDYDLHHDEDEEVVDDRPGSPSGWARLDDAHDEHNEGQQAYGSLQHRQEDLFNTSAEHPQPQPTPSKSREGNADHSHHDNVYQTDVTTGGRTKSAAHGRRKKRQEKDERHDVDGFSSTSDEFESPF